MVMRTFKKDFLTEELGLPWDSCFIIYDKIIDNTRWSIIHELVFEIKEEGETKYYKTTYSEGATEFQPERPWEYKDEVECIEVEQRTVTRVEWVPITKE